MRSELCLYDLAFNSVTPLMATDRHIEAPNWSPDGTHLIVNGSGHLYRVDIDDPRLQPVDTGFANLCNNDHGLSPDGKTLVISDSSKTGESCIYVLPAQGGEPRRVTQLVPSWWHGWSPDGRMLAYTARRAGRFWIASIPVGGGDETLLIGGDGAHCDGPDYTPDGQWIWFNSDRGGSMQLWRMRTDGSDAEAMTAGERVNWFPHPSPDGRHVLYLSYEAGTTGHPENRNVELRRLDSGTGRTLTLTSLLGGQGSINVPCWSPDGRQFAFMRYARH